MYLYIWGFSFEVMDMLEMLFCVLCHSGSENGMLTMCFLSVALNPLLLVWYNKISFNWQSFRKPFLWLCFQVRHLGFDLKQVSFFQLQLPLLSERFFNKGCWPTWQYSFLSHLHARLFNMQKLKVAHIYQNFLSDPWTIFLVFLSGGLVQLLSAAFF